MRVALVYPGKKVSEKQLPLGIAYLASYIRAHNSDIEVKTLDTTVAKPTEIDSFVKDKYDLVGISSSSRVYSEALELADRFKSHNPQVITVLGGPHVSIMREQVLQEPLFDLAIYGEGELTLDELTRVVRAGDKLKPQTLANIKGLIYRDGKRVVVNPPRELIKDLDSLDFPAFDLFHVDRYPGKLPLISSRGCPFSCVFCASTQIWGRRWRARSPENIVAEVQHLLRTVRPRPIDFHDDSFNMSLERVNNICDLLIEKKVGIPWGIRGFRADIINPETAQKMRRAGCTHVAIGIESANDEMLVRMGKKESIATIEKGINILHDAGIDVIGQFMIGNPGETLETVKESIEFVKNSNLSKAVFGGAVPFPKTKLWDYVQQHGKLLVECDCTQFEDVEPRVLFETPEFSKEERLLALKMAEEAESMTMGRASSSVTSRFKNALRRIWFRNIYGILPKAFAYRCYFVLRWIKRKGLLGKW